MTVNKNPPVGPDNQFGLVSLFAGCGGLDLGFKGGFEFLGNQFPHLPFNTLLANEWNISAAKTFSHNFPNVPISTQDVREIVGSLGEVVAEVDVLTGGFPCQDFSLAGRRQGLNVQRGQLYLSMVEAVRSTRPKIFLAENVRGLVTWEKGLAISVITRDFADLGYRVEFKLLNAADFGVPQIRRRVIIVGVRADLDADFLWPDATHSNDPVDGLPTWVSSREAIGDLEDDKILGSLPNPGYSKAKVTPGRQGNKPLLADAPSVTIRAEHHGNIEFHYKKTRRLSAREAARLQSFPDDFVFFNSTTDAYRQIGNAVAPVFSWHLASAVASFLNRL